METLLPFVLGALCGLFLIGIIYIFYGVLKTQSELKKIKETLKSFENIITTQEGQFIKKYEDINRDMHDMISDVRRQIDNRTEDIDKIISANYSDVHASIDKIYRYVDSRIDKTIDNLNTKKDLKPS